MSRRHVKATHPQSSSKVGGGSVSTSLRGGGCRTLTFPVRGTTTETDRETYTPTFKLPPYAVILHNDDHNSMGHVVSALLKSVSSLSREDAVRIMLEAHNSGLAVVIVCPLEQAELYRDRLRSFNLGVTIEKK